MIEPDVRRTLETLIREKGADYSALSRMLGRNAAYIQQFIRRGVPRKLDEGDRRTLARYFGVDERLLGAPDPAEGGAGLLAVPRLGVGASAGPGAINADERAIDRIGFPPAWLRALKPSHVDNLSLIRVQGESMHPTLSDGDDILVDRGDGAERLRDGIYVLRVDEALNVKRIALSPRAGVFSVISDNPDFPRWPDCTLENISVVGRVLWAGRRL